MASSFDFYTKHFEKLNDGLEAYWTGVAGEIATAITPVATTLLGIYIVLWGWSVMRGIVKEPFADGAFRILRLVTVLVLALKVGQYSGFLADMLWKTPEALGSIVAGGTSGASGVAFIDNLMSSFYDMGAVYNQKAYASSGLTGIPDLSLWFSGLAIWVVGIAVTGYAAFLFVLSKTALALLLGIGPIFILLTMFEPTKRFFDAWLGQTVNYVLMAVLVAGAVRLILSIAQTYLGSPAVIAAMGDPKINQILPVIAFGIIGMLVMMQVPSIASALGGGVAIGTLGAMGYAYGRAKGAMGSGRDLATGKTLSDMRGARRAKAINARWAASNPALPMAVYRKVTGGSQNRVARG